MMPRDRELEPGTAVAPGEPVRYFETQTFAIRRSIVLLVVVTGTILIALANDLWQAIHRPDASGATELFRDIGAPGIVTLAVVGAVAWLLVRARLRTTVTAHAVQIRFVPFHRRAVEIPINSIEDTEMKTYNALLEYGGWGIRWGWRGKAYNTRGRKGVLLSVRGRSRIMIGSQRPKELADAIRMAQDEDRRRDGLASNSDDEAPPPEPEVEPIQPST